MLRAGPVPVKGKCDIAERGMGFRKSVIEFNGSRGGCFGLGHHFQRSSVKSVQNTQWPSRWIEILGLALAQPSFRVARKARADRPHGPRDRQIAHWTSAT